MRSCVESLINCPLTIQIIVVDNASTDGSLSYLVDYPHVRVIKNERNLGFAAACNVGLSVATAEHILFLNPDCSFKPGALRDLLSALRSDEYIGMVGPLLVNPDGSEQAGGRRAVPTPWRSFVRAVGLSRFADRWPSLFFDFHLHNQPLPAEPTEVEAISGACMLVKREVVNKVGTWDESYFLHCEDLDWCMRFRQEGWKIMFVPSVRITHELGVCSRNRRFFVEWHKHKGMIRFYQKFFQHQYPWGLMLIVALGVWGRFVFVSLYLTVMRLGLIPNDGRMGDLESLGSGDQFPNAKDNQVKQASPAFMPEVKGNESHLISQNLMPVGVLGASSLVGAFMLPLLTAAGYRINAYSRGDSHETIQGVTWRKILATESESCLPREQPIPLWICLAPIWTLPNYFDALLQAGVTRIVVLSSTSRFAKIHSSSETEQRLVHQLEEGEAQLRSWAEQHGVEWVLIRPTLIYGRNLDKNITEIARFIKRFGFFPLFGKANGKRQPIHAEDVALSCSAALISAQAKNQAYNISGGEVLSYREMVGRIFMAQGKTPRFLPIPLWMFRVAVGIARILPRYRRWSSAMVERMNQDMAFEHAEAVRDLGIQPRDFHPTREDV